VNNDLIIAEIKRRILQLIVDNPPLAIVQLQLETAALIGASVATEHFAASLPEVPEANDNILKGIFLSE